MSLLERIVVDPELRIGEPTVRGTRLTVSDVLGYLESMSEEELLAAFSQLALEDVKACIAYAEQEQREVERVRDAWAKLRAAYLGDRAP